jgi:NAD(P)-dependent dehydrogenase (short-subunit alcohol dehydrogenase family)
MLSLVSVAGQIGSQTDPPYSAAKAELINFAQCAARDLAPMASGATPSRLEW